VNNHPESIGSSKFFKFYHPLRNYWLSDINDHSGVETPVQT